MSLDVEATWRMGELVGPRIVACVWSVDGD